MVFSHLAQKEQPSRRYMTSSAAPVGRATRLPTIAISAMRNSRTMPNPCWREPAILYSCSLLNVSESMISRRSFLASAAACSLLRPERAFAAATLTEDGLYRQPWYLESLLELADDLTETTQKKKRFAVVWELRG